MTHARATRASGRLVAVLSILCVIAITVGLLLLIGCHDGRMSALPETPIPMQEVAASMPDTPWYYVTVTDPLTGEPIQHIKVKDNPSKSGPEITRTSLANVIRMVGARHGRQDVIDSADNVVLWSEVSATDARVKRPIGGGVTCTCGTLSCDDPSVCGVHCGGPCDRCFVC